MADFQRGSGQFPKWGNREFQSAEQGIILARTGKNSGVSGIARGSEIPCQIARPTQTARPTTFEAT